MSRDDPGWKPGVLFRRKASSKPAANGWRPAARIAAIVMLGALGGADIWVFTMAEIAALPQLQVNLNPATPNSL